MTTELDERSLTTADLAAAVETSTAPREAQQAIQQASTEIRSTTSAGEGEQLIPLFLADAANDFRSRWDAVQIGFVDDPKQAVRHGDELVAQVMKSLAQTFSSERAKLESQMDQAEKASTEDLRVALRRYRSFFERLLAL